MSENEIKFKARIDQDKLIEDAKTIAQTIQSMMGPQNMQRSASALDRNLDKLGVNPGNSSGYGAQNAGMAKAGFQEQLKREVETLNVRREIYRSHVEELRKMEDAYDKMNKKTKEAAIEEDKIAKKRENNLKLQESIIQKTEALTKASSKLIEDDQPDKNSTSSKFAGNAMNANFKGMGMNALEAIGGEALVSVVGAMGAAMAATKVLTTTFNAFAREISSRPREIANAQAASISGSAGVTLSNVYGGHSAMDMGNAKAHQIALQRAMEEENATRSQEGRAAGDWGQGHMFDMQENMGKAANAWRLIPGLGDQQLRNRYIGSLGFGSWSKGYRDSYNANRTKEMIGKTQSNFEDELAKDPGKRFALGDWEQNYGQHLETQRGMGLNDNQYFQKGGYLDNISSNGFQKEQGLASSRAIQGAGGSTSMMNDPAGSLKFQRAFDLTNSDQVLGKISNNYGDASTSKTALVSILGELKAIGMNTKEFVEEQRKFADASASYLQKGFVGSNADQARMGHLFGSAVDQKTGVGIASATSAMDTFSGISSQGQGPEGALGFASILSDPVLSQLGARDQQSMNTMRFEDLSESNPRIAYWASKAGVSPQEIIKRLKRAMAGKLFRNKDLQREASAFNKMKRDPKNAKYAKMTPKELADAAKTDSAASDYLNAKGKYQSDFAPTQTGLSGDQNKLSSMANLAGSIADESDEGGMSDADMADTMNQYNDGNTGRAADARNAAGAHDQGLVLEKTSKMLDDFNNMAAASQRMTTALLDAMNKLEATAKSVGGVSSEKYLSDQDDALRGIKRTYGAAEVVRPDAPKNQSQGGKKSGN